MNTGLSIQTAKRIMGLSATNAVQDTYVTTAQKIAKTFVESINATNAAPFFIAHKFQQLAMTMPTMRNYFAFTATLVALFLSGCLSSSNNAEFVGTWEASFVRPGDVQMSIRDNGGGNVLIKITPETALFGGIAKELIPAEIVNEKMKALGGMFDCQVDKQTKKMLCLGQKWTKL
jgi:hypothetical protein